MEKNKYGDVVFKSNDDIPIEIAMSSNPFGEKYLVVTSSDIIVAALVIEKKKSGTIEFRNKANAVTKILLGEKREEEIVKPRTL